MSFAFSGGDLQANYCMQTPDLTDSIPLDNDFHPIFQPQNFRVGIVTNGLGIFYSQDPQWQSSTDMFPSQLYDRILPAVRLASLMLDRSIPFFNRIWHAQEISHPGLLNHTYLDSTQVANCQEMDQTIQSLLSFAACIRFYISSLGRDSPSPSGDIWQGITYSALNSKISPLPQLCIGLEYGFIDFFAGEQYSRASEEGRLRANFMLARLMMHELAHGFRQWRALDEISKQASAQGKEVSIFGGPPTLEPWYCDVTKGPQDPENELGRAWEDWFFNGCIKSIGFRKDYNAPFGFAIISWSDWFERRQKGGISTKPVYTALTAVSISRLFNARFWSSTEATENGVVSTLR